MPRESSGIDAMQVGIFHPHPRAYTDTPRFARVAPSKGSSFVYIYNLGDNWHHDTLVEDVLPRTQGTKVPSCLGGERARPQEDCGGTGGCEDIVKTLANPKYQPQALDRDELIKWLPEEYDPGEFDIGEVNGRLSEYEGG